MDWPSLAKIANIISGSPVSSISDEPRFLLLEKIFKKGSNTDKFETN